MRGSIFATLCLALLMGGCGGRVVPPAQNGGRAAVAPPALNKPAPIQSVRPMAAVPQATATGPNAKSAGVVAGPAFSTLGVTASSAARALLAFRASCPALLRRTDQSGLTTNSDWQTPCTAAQSVANGDAPRFFEERFDVVQVGSGAAHATGYFIPEIEGSRTRRAGYDVPVYARPSELVELDLGQFSDSLKGKKIRGRVSGNNFVPFADRAAIEGGTLAGRGLEIAWAKDPVEFFFLQVQGSGILRLAEGGTMLIGYDGQNGRDYTGIGKLMKDRGLLGPGQSSMQGIVDWLRANPDQGQLIMQENKSWVFFRELKTSGAVGALGIEVMPRATVAADPMFVPLGAPVFLSLDRAEPNGLWVAQDTGGAIKGANRFDTFWGAGAEARTLAGGMSARGTALILLPKDVFSRLGLSNGTPTP